MRKLRRLLFRLFLFIFLIILAVVVVKTISFSSNQISVAAIDKISVANAVSSRLADVVKIPTNSYKTHVDTNAFVQYHEYVDSIFPNVDSLLQKDTINEFSRIYKWQGRNTKLKPYLLIAHLDVVPVEEASQSQWTEPPYSGNIKDGFIWGRGTLDDKVSAMAILETIEKLLKEDFQPERTLYLGFGHDEEVGGIKGAKSIVEYFSKKEIKFEYVLDEGSLIVENAIPGLTKPAALIGNAEKGYATLELDLNMEHGGHSSMPPQETAIGIMSNAIVKLQDNPFPAELNENARSLFDNLGPEMTLPTKAVFANLWLLEGVLISQLEKSGSSNAMLRTTTAPTIIKGGVKENVLPTSVSTQVNFRILPGETIESVIETVKKIIDDERIKVELKGSIFASNPSKVSDVNTFGFNALEKTVREIFPEAVVSPSLVIATTDSRHYGLVSENIYRFMPVQLDNSDLKRIHGIDERISVESYKDMIRYYHQLIKNSSI